MAKSNDKEKYEKIYAEFLDFETKAANATDAIKQMSSLACVYFLLGDESIDSFDGSLQAKKMAIMEADIELHAFFLNLQTRAIEHCQRRLNLISAIASPQAKEWSAVLDQKYKEHMMPSET